MKRSTDRILTTHAGSLPRPDDLPELLNARQNLQLPDEAAFTSRVRSAVDEVVQLQLGSGVDCVNDGELGKSNFNNYAQLRLAGFEEREVPAGQGRAVGIQGRDLQEFAEYFASGGGGFASTNAVNRRQIGARGFGRQLYVTGPLTYVGQDEIQRDIATFKAALQAHPAGEAFLPAVAPGTIEHWLNNDYYPSDEAYLFAIADAMHEEYKAITDAGFILQIDDPDLPDAWQMHPDFSVADYRKFAELRIDALNHALRDLPEEQIRLHVCWGSYHGPHKHDIPLRDIVDLVLKVKAQAYSVEGANPRHEHEWKVWQDTKLPQGKIVIPGV